MKATLEAPTAPTPGTNVDFKLRRDLRLGTGLLGDLLLEDFNGDGVLDVAVSEFLDRRVLVALGDGAGDFDLMAQLDTPANPLNLASGDYDGNGLRDIAAACSIQVGTGDPVVAVILQTEAGVWDTQMVMPFVLPEEPFDIITSVMQPGGTDALLVTVPDARQTLWLALAGLELQLEGSFSSATGESQGGRPLTLAAYDVDLDERLDLVVGEFEQSGVPTGRVISFGNLPDLADAAEGGSPGNPFTVLGGGFSDPIVRETDDVDGDGRGELVVAEFSGTGVSLFGEVGKGGEVGVTERVEFGSGITAVLVDDIDADGVADLAVTLVDDNAIAVHFGGTGALGEGLPTLYSVGRVPRAIAAGDLQGDQALDLVCCNFDDLSCVFGRGGRDLRAASGIALTGTPETLLCADLDGDGNDDLAVIDGGQTRIDFFQGDGQGVTPAGSVTLDEGEEDTPGFMIAEDFDGDGDLEILTSFYNGGAVGLLRNEGGLPLSAPASEELVAVGDRPIGLGAGRLDGDDTLDAVVGNFGDNTLQVLFGAGDGTFAASEPFAVPAPPLAVAVEDYDGDGALDLAVSTGAKISATPDAFVLVYRGNGDGTFSADPVSTTPLNLRAPTLAAADFDGDGLPDLVASQPADVSNSIYYLGNGGDFDFGSRVIQVGLNPGALSVADIDVDGNQDILVPLGVGELRVLLGAGDGTFVVPPQTNERFLSVPARTSSVALCNVVGTALPDLVVVSPTAPILWIGENLGVPAGN